MFDLLVILHNKSIAQVIPLRIVVPEVGRKLAFLEVSEHVVDVIDGHIYSHDRWPKFPIPDACGSLEILLEESFEVQLRDVFPSEVADQLQGLVHPRVEGV